MRLRSSLAAPAVLALAGCNTIPPAPAPDVSIINSLSFNHAISGKRDAMRTAWPMDQLPQTTELFPLAQVKQCDKTGEPCRWGIVRAKRTFGKVAAAAAGVALELELVLDVARSQRAHGRGQYAAMSIPGSVASIPQGRHTVKRALVLEYGKVQRIDLGHGISYELCALRLDAARKAIDTCAIDYI
jgi:hypothetical protein